MNYKRSRKGFTLVEIMIVVVIIGLLASMAVPAFNKVRESARKKAIVNNLRQIASAGQQYLIENGTAGSVDYQTLVDDDYLKAIDPVTDEDYSSVIVTDANQVQTISVDSTILNDTIEYSF